MVAIGFCGLGHLHDSRYDPLKAQRACWLGSGELFPRAHHMLCLVYCSQGPAGCARQGPGPLHTWVFPNRHSSGWELNPAGVWLGVPHGPPPEALVHIHGDCHTPRQALNHDSDSLVNRFLYRNLLAVNFCLIYYPSA